MKNDSKGVLSIEAIVSLTTFLFFMMFIMNFGHIYQVQNIVTHGALQTGKMLAFNSFSYDQISPTNEITIFLKGLNLFGSDTDTADGNIIERNWRYGKKYGEAADIVFDYFVSADELQKYRIEAVDFSKTEVKDDKLILNISYDVKLPYAVFNLKKITLHQQVVCGLWK